METIHIDIRKGDRYGDVIADASFSHDVSEDEVAAIAAVAIDAVARGLALAVADKRKQERRTQGDASIKAIFEDIRKSIEAEFGPKSGDALAFVEELRDEARQETLDSRDPRYVPSEDEIVKEHDPGPEVDDEGGMSERRFLEAVDPINEQSYGSPV